MRIQTERLVLRPAEATDLLGFHAILSDPEGMRWWSSAPHNSLAQTQEWLTGMMSGPQAKTLDLVIEFEGRVAGKAGFWRPPEVGYILSRSLWGRGLATEAVGAMLNAAFSGPTALDWAEADVDPGNAPSIKILQKLGFEKTGHAERTLNIEGRWFDSDYFRLDRHIWQARPDLSL